MIPADCIIVNNNRVLSNEASLTGEPDDLKKTKDKDCFLLSSAVITEGEECRAIVTGIGPSSQWGRIKANLVMEASNTPLQDKLEGMTTQVYSILPYFCRVFDQLSSFADRLHRHGLCRGDVCGGGCKYLGETPRRQRRHRNNSGVHHSRHDYSGCDSRGTSAGCDDIAGVLDEENVR